MFRGNSCRWTVQAGSCKALLEMDGQPILSRLCQELSCFEPIFLSVNQPLPTPFPSFKLVQDLFPDCGPLAGIHAALSKTQKEALFCISCDLPCFSSELISFLTEQLCEQTDVLICQDHTGKLHPLCGIYRKRILPQLEQSLCSHQYKVMDFVQKTNYAVAKLPEDFSDNILFNMNTPEDYRLAKKLITQK